MILVVKAIATEAARRCTFCNSPTSPSRRPIYGPESGKENRSVTWFRKPWKTTSADGASIVSRRRKEISLAEKSSWQKTLTVVAAALEKKASNLSVLCVRDLTSIADYFVICSGRSD